MWNKTWLSARVLKGTCFTFFALLRYVVSCLWCGVGKQCMLAWGLFTLLLSAHTYQAKVRIYY